VTYPGGGGGEWPPQNNPQFGGQQGYPQTGPQPPQGYPQTGPQPAQAYPAGQQWEGAPGGGQPQFGGPQYGQQPFGQQPFGYAGGEPPKKKRTGLIVTAIVAVIALAAGTVVTVWALKKSDTQAGAPTPAAAANNLVNALGSGDVIGVINGLAPAEAALSKDYVDNSVEEYKRLEILKADADPNKLSGFELKTEGVKFDEAAAEKVNDHLTINKLTEGKLTITSDIKKAPLTDKMVKALGTKIDQEPKTETIDIAQKIKDQNNGEPVRIASIKVGDEWYPSLFYTMADYALRANDLKWPSNSIPAQGAGSAADAAKQIVEAALDADLNKVIGLLPPDEMAVLHDVGPVLVDRAGSASKSGAKLIDLQTDQKDVTGGKQLTVKKLTMEIGGEKGEVVREGNCYTATAQGQTQKWCADQITQMLEQQAGSELPPAAIDVVSRIGAQMFEDGLGVVATEVDGKWYVSPGRTLNEIWMTLLRGLQPKDVDELLKLAK
jgi:hypothetical protein